MKHRVLVRVAMVIAVCGIIGVALNLFESSANQTEFPGLVESDSFSQRRLLKVGEKCVVEFTAVDCDFGTVCNVPGNSTNGVGTCGFCEITAQCMSDDLVCAPTKDRPGKKTCQHKSLFPNFLFSDWVGTIFGVMFCALAAGGGIGGGGLLVPLFIVLVRFPPSGAIPLSKATIFGGALANLLLNIRKRHPTANRPLIDYQTAGIMEPMTLAGTLIGVLFNRIFPDWLVVVLLIVVLGSTTYRTGTKGWALHQSEMAQEYVPIAQDEDEVDGENDLLLSEMGMSSDSFGEQSLAQIVLEESKIDWSTIGVLSSCWVLILLTSLLKGGEGAASLVGVQCGTFSYWSIFIAIIPVFLLLTYATGKRLHARWLRKRELLFKFHKGDVEWNQRNVIMYPLMCTTAGIAAGLLGIGGGMVKGPLMLEMGIEPQVASATSAFMILFTSSSTTVQFIVLGALQADYAIWYACWGFVATYVGQIVINHYVKKHRKTSYIVLSIALVIGTSALFMTVDGGWNIIRKVKRQKYMGFRELCE